MNRIRVAVGDSIGTIVLARPDRKNALDREAADDLLDAIDQLGRHAGASVIVLRAEGQDFCAGADLHALRALLDQPLHVHEADARALGDVFLALHQCAKPTVAVVKGRALAGGAGLATACDMIIAHESAQFAYPEVAIGFVPAIAMAMLVRAVGERVAFDLVATGRSVSASEAERMGLVSRCVAHDDFDARTDDVIKMLANAPAPAMAATKKLLHDLRPLDAVHGVAASVHVNAQARLTDDFKRGVLRFTGREATP